MTMSKKEYSEWWTSVWSEREDLFRKLFGETTPPGKVVAFDWEDISLVLPGACALEFAPNRERTEWLTVSHGLTQPLQPMAVAQDEYASGYGYEFGVLTQVRENWCPQLLQLLMTYLRQTGKPIDRGHRVPIWFASNLNHFYPTMGKLPAEQVACAFGKVRAFLFWPYLKYAGGFRTSTGYFSILLGTAITEHEWEMAKSTSSSHLLLLFMEAGIGQISDLKRNSVTDVAEWRQRWEVIRHLSQQQIDVLLGAYCK